MHPGCDGRRDGIAWLLLGDFGPLFASMCNFCAWALGMPAESGVPPRLPVTLFLALDLPLLLFSTHTRRTALLVPSPSLSP